MFKQAEESYRKWLAIRQEFKDSAMILNMCGGVKFKSGGKTLLELSQEEFETLTANEIVEKLRSNKDDN